MSQLEVMQSPSLEFAVETIDLTKRYGSLAAIDALNMEVPLGSVYAVIGPNGAGKTTTFQILSTLLDQSSGIAVVMGMDTQTHAFEIRRQVGFMPDEFGLYDDMTVFEYLDFFARGYRIKGDLRAKTIRDLLELVDLTHKSKDLVEALSRGMKQRLGLARALVHEPSVLILDEPASGLDPRARIEFRELISELRKLGKTIIISSHILSELQEVCTHVGILEAGHLLAQGPPSEILGKMPASKVFAVRLLHEEQVMGALSILEGDPLVLSVEQTDGGFDVVYSATQGSAILTKLVHAGIQVTQFQEIRAGLEDLFLRVTKGVVR